jgi:hypothetical protein
VASRLAVAAVVVLLLVGAADALRDRGPAHAPPAAPPPAAVDDPGASVRAPLPACHAPARGEDGVPPVVTLECDHWTIDGADQVVLSTSAPEPSP